MLKHKDIYIKPCLPQKCVDLPEEEKIRRPFSIHCNGESVWLPRQLVTMGTKPYIQAPPSTDHDQRLARTTGTWIPNIKDNHQRNQFKETVMFCRWITMKETPDFKQLTASCLNICVHNTDRGGCLPLEFPLLCNWNIYPCLVWGLQSLKVGPVFLAHIINR